MNTGKIFENNFKKSVPSDYYYVRLKDPAVSFSGGNSRFSPNNPYDCLIYTGTALHCMELKSKDGAISFWDKRFETDGKKHTFEIKKCQINGLTDAASHDNTYAGLVMNFRNTGQTVYVPISKFNDFVSRTGKKSINVSDAIEIGVLVGTIRLKVNDRYDIRSLCEEVESVGRNE